MFKYFYNTIKKFNTILLYVLQINTHTHTRLSKRIDD